MIITVKVQPLWVNWTNPKETSVIKHNRFANRLIPVPTRIDSIRGNLGGTNTSLLNYLINKL